MRPSALPLYKLEHLKQNNSLDHSLYNRWFGGVVLDGLICVGCLRFLDFEDEADGIYSDVHDFLMSADGRTMNDLV